MPPSWVGCLENIKAEAASRGVKAASPIRPIGEGRPKGQDTKANTTYQPNIDHIFY